MEYKESNVIENLNLGKAAVIEYTDLVNTLKHYWEYNAPMKYGEWYFLLDCNHEPGYIFGEGTPTASGINLFLVLNFDFRLEDIKKKIKKLKTQCAYQLQAKQIGSEWLQKKLKEKERKMFLLMEEIGRALEPEREMMERHKAIKEKNKKDCSEPPQPEPTFDWGDESILEHARRISQPELLKADAVEEEKNVEENLDPKTIDELWDEVMWL